MKKIVVKDGCNIEYVINVCENDEFHETYPNWCISCEGGKYDNLPRELFLIHNNPKVTYDEYSAIDNRHGDAWVEDFETEQQAIYWLIDEVIDPDESYIIPINELIED